MDYGFNTRRRRNMDLSKIKGDFKRPRNNTFGIDWDQGRTSVEDEEPMFFDTDSQIEGKEAKAEIPLEVPGVIEAKDFARQLSTAPLQENHTMKIEIAGQCLHVSPFYQKENHFDTKITVYLPKNLTVLLKELKKAKEIPSYSWLVAEAITYYLRSKGTTNR